MEIKIFLGIFFKTTEKEKCVITFLIFLYNLEGKTLTGLFEGVFSAGWPKLAFLLQTTREITKNSLKKPDTLWFGETKLRVLLFTVLLKTEREKKQV